MRRVGLSLAFVALLALLGVGGAIGRHIAPAALHAAHHQHESHGCCPVESASGQRLACPHLPGHLGGPLVALASLAVTGPEHFAAPEAARPLAGHQTSPAIPPPRSVVII